MAKKRRDGTTRYAEEVVAGRSIAGRLVRLACERHLRDLTHGNRRGLVFDVDAAERVFGFFQTLRLTEGEYDGKPFVLQPFQQFILGSIFGWKMRDGSRRFRTAYIESGKGSGKSPLAAGIGLYGLTADGESGAEIYSAAVSRDQAKILFRDAENMVLTSPDLRAHVQRHVGNLSVPSTFSFFRPVSSEHRGLDGKRVHMALIDEVHVHPDALVVDKMRAGTKGRRQALILLITNSGTDRNSVCWHYHEMSRKVVSGEIENDSVFAYVCQLDPCAACLADGKTQPVDGCAACDDWRDERTWIKANPCLGVSITTRYLAEQVQEAVQMPSKENIVKRLNFCLWTEQSVRWMPMAAWDACPSGTPDERLIGASCYAGLDLASRTDLCALVLFFPNVDGRAVVRPFFWAPREGAERRQEVDHVPYLDWYKQGLVELTDGNATDYDVIRAKIRELNDLYRIHELGFDPWNAQQLCTQLMDDGLTVVELRQNFANLSGPMKELESLVTTKALEHGGHPILRWMASNVSATMDKVGNIKPGKERYSEKIDGIVALIMAIARWSVHQGTGSVYENRDILTVGG
jgi:phage terminase large subunit-like protein